MDTPISLKMKEHKFNDASLAEHVGCERSFITKIKLGRARPSLEVALKLSDALDMPPSAFMAPKQGQAA